MSARLHILALCCGLIATLPALATDQGRELHWGVRARHQVGQHRITIEEAFLDGALVLGHLRVRLTAPWGEQLIHRPLLGWNGVLPEQGTEPLGEEESWQHAARHLLASQVAFWSQAPGAVPVAYVMDPRTESLRLVRRHHVVVHDEYDERELWIVQEDGSCAVDRSLLRHAEVQGTVLGNVVADPLPFQPAAPLVQAPLAHLTLVPVGVGPVTTDAAGNFSFTTGASGPVTVVASLAGPHFSVHNLAGSDLQYIGSLATGSPQTLVFNDPPGEFGTAQVAAFDITARSLQALEALAPGLATGLPPLAVNVNLNGSCYAFYSPIFGAYFTRSGSGCPNAAYGTVVAHEYLHHLFASTAGVCTPAYEEAMADVFAAYLLDDPRIGADLLGPGLPLRDLVGTAQFPSGSPNPATVGLPLAQAFWDLRQNLILDLGHLAGTQLASELWLGSLLLGNGIVGPGVVVDLLLLDDDDGDPSNGSPHRVAIVSAFTGHGFPAPVQPVENLVCARAELIVELSWTLSTVTNYTSILVNRDGLPIVNLFGVETEFADVFPPAGNHTYSVTGMVGGSMAASRSCQIEVPPHSPFIRGDTNQDGILNLVDVIDLLDQLFHAAPTPGCEDARDVNDSGVIDISDPVYLLDHLFLQQTPPSAPFPLPGFDPTADALSCP